MGSSEAELPGGRELLPVTMLPKPRLTMQEGPDDKRIPETVCMSGRARRTAFPLLAARPWH